MKIDGKWHLQHNVIKTMVTRGHFANIYWKSGQHYTQEWHDQLGIVLHSMKVLVNMYTLQ